MDELKGQSLNRERMREFIREKLKQVYIPSSVYRIQFNSKFTFRQAKACLPYFKELGIDALYCSPLFQAMPGSMHGYDISDPNKINPELGTEEDFNALVEEAQRNGMGMILDVVPNHMGVGSNNPFWMDVLENGQSSKYAAFFDIDWSPVKKELRNKVLLPILGDVYGTVLERKELQLSFAEGEFWINYWDHKLPVSPKTYPIILECGLEDLVDDLKEENPDLQEYLSIVSAYKNLPGITEKEPGRIFNRQREKGVAKKRLFALFEKSGAIKEFIDRRVEIFNGQKGNPKSFDFMHHLLAKQAYRLSFWRVAAEEINYRRFFDVNDLAAIRMEDEEVFEEHHRRLFDLIREGKVKGLRIDHPDGLYDPPAYFQRLQKRVLIQLLEDSAGSGTAGLSELENMVDSILAEDEFKTAKPLFVVVEKILERKEDLPPDWNVHGTVGYGFLNSLNGLFVNREKEKEFSELYENFIGHGIDFEQLVYDKKKFFALIHMSSEINSLANRLDRISEGNRRYRDFTLNNLTLAIREVIASFPVYRTYIRPDASEISESDEKYIHIAVEKAKRRTPALSSAVYDFLKEVLTLRFTGPVSPGEQKLYTDFVLRFQQITGPIMAKGLEDTTFYIYNRLISLNEVGGDPTHFAFSRNDFHKQNAARNKNWPAAFIATSTHDTKRSEDVRMRINVLSELPEEWKVEIAKWSILNEKHKTLLQDSLEPRKNAEYYIYQILAGVWKEGLKEIEVKAVAERVWACVQKSVREAKIYTNWVSPNQEYEEAVRKFVFGILETNQENPFLEVFADFHRKIAFFGMLNSLSALALKLASPGVPDTYQGTDLWDDSLVDPDNRRPVDYELRMRLLTEAGQCGIENPARTETLTKLMQNASDGRIKLFILREGLQARSRDKKLFVGAEYIPLQVTGVYERHVVAFARKTENGYVIAASVRFFAELLGENLTWAPAADFWKDTAIALPKEMGRDTVLHDIFTQAQLPCIETGDERIARAADIFSVLPCAVFVSPVLERKQ